MTNDDPRRKLSAGDLSPGVVALLAEIRSALDLSAGDYRLPGRAVAVRGVIVTVLNERATDADCELLASVLHDAARVTA
jgi:hypothetical protein